MHTIPSRPGTEVCTFTNKISFKNTLTVWTINLTSRFRNKPKKKLSTEPTSWLQMPQHSKDTKQTWGGNKNVTYERVLKEVPRVPASPPKEQLSSRLQSRGFNKTQEAIKKGQEMSCSSCWVAPSPQPPALGGGHRAAAPLCPHGSHSHGRAHSRQLLWAPVTFLAVTFQKQNALPTALGLLVTKGKRTKTH